MNEPMQEKEFNLIINRMRQLSETRDKFIYEIDDILDRIKPNKKPEKGTALSSAEGPTMPVFTRDMNYLLNEMDSANERLSGIVKRLNELI